MLPSYEILPVKTGDSETRILRFGEGERPFVLIPGLSVTSVLDTAPAVVRAYTPFAKTHTVYLPDRPVPAPREATIEKLAESLLGALNTLGVENADVAGISQGGMIALCLTALSPKTVRRLALCSSTSFVTDSSFSVIQSWRELAKTGDAAALYASFYEKLFSPPLARLLSRAPVPELGEKAAARFCALAGAAEGFDFRGRLAEIPCPVLVLGAENDAVLGDGAKETARLLGCDSFFYPAPYGHGVYDEAEDFKTRLLSFFLE